MFLACLELPLRIKFKLRTSIQDESSCHDSKQCVPCANRSELFLFDAGQVEDLGAHSQDLPTAEEGRTGPSRALGPGPLRPLLLVTEASQAPAEATCSSVNKPMTDPM